MRRVKTALINIIDPTINILNEAETEHLYQFLSSSLDFLYIERRGGWGWGGGLKLW